VRIAAAGRYLQGLRGKSAAPETPDFQPNKTEPLKSPICLNGLNVASKQPFCAACLPLDIHFSNRLNWIRTI